MKKLIYSFSLLIVVSLCQAQSKSQSDIKHLELDLRFDWAKKQAYGTSTITLLSTTREIFLDGKALVINSVKDDQGNSLKFKYDANVEDDGLKIVLNRKPNLKEVITLIIDYRTNWVNDSDPNNIWGSFGKGIRFFEPTTTEPNRQRQIWSVGEPESNRYWFPNKDSPDDLRTTTFIATIEKPLKVISNGELRETKDNGDGTQTFTWETTTPYANHLTSFVAGRYLDVTQQFEDVEIHNYCYPHEADATAASVARLPDMMNFYSEVTGVKYPYISYSQVFVQDFGGWMGNMMISTITENMVDDWVTHKDFRYLWDITQSEALATQWFGNLVAVDDWSHAWLSKSFARHLSGLYNEYKNGREEFLTYQLLPDQTAYLSDWNSGIRQLIVNTNYDDVQTFVNSNHPYLHGSSMLNMLRFEVGEDKWQSILKSYVEDNSFKTVTTHDFQKVVNKIAVENMDWFFDQWIYNVGHPVFEVTKSYDQSTKKLILVVRQTQEVDESNEIQFFRGNMGIEIDKQIMRVSLQPKEENVFTFDLAIEPQLVNFDFESTWLKEVTFQRSMKELLYQFENSKDVLARIDAMNQLSTIASKEETLDTTKSTIYGAYRKTILNHTYWRLRMLTLWQLQGLLVASNPDPVFDQVTIDMLQEVIKKDESWVKSSAIWFLGMTKNPKYDWIYIDAFEDWSDRVTNAAAIALGKTKSSKAYDALIALKDKPSWKNQSLISSLNGLQQLEDPRGIDLALKSLTNAEEAHWTLGTPIWDHRLAAAGTLVALDEANEAYPIIFTQFSKAMEENDLNDIFYNTLQVVTLADPRGQEVFELLKTKFKNDDNTMKTIEVLETQFMKVVKK